MSWKRKGFLKANALAKLGWAVNVREFKPSRYLRDEKMMRVAVMGSTT